MANTHHSNDSTNNTNNSSSSADDEVINHEQFEDMRDLLEEDFADLIQTYIIDSQQRIKLLRTTQASDDNANGFEAAHALKGASANVGATHLVTLSEQLQEACRKRNIGQQAKLIDQTAIALQQVELEIHKRLGQ
ncbi:Hpt domain-containing protein [Psychrobacter sp. LV10R520-6]|uniref:Hpt domain-containing protein n=1 Tax=Psychrobacter sp. LV10R520-6 TaxID=1415574 RepID=UPI0024CC22E5|nr:Hpt domain-containing protein [Psychrobacter sp. LV10R520-6]SNT69917.1 HPt (histidine-containing phosphotransfer) domain-containing protein [Psychrobacter sp. LV10R520-6]